MIIRPATETDLPTLLEIYNDIILHTTAVYSYEPHTLEMRKAWYKDKVDQHYPVFVAEDNGRPVGFSTFGPFRAWPAYQFTVENSIYVAADQRGKGLGRALLAPLIDAARKKGMHALIAGIDSTNDASLRLHKAFGFEEVARFREVGFKFERWLDLVFMELILS
ncbi:GNAT family N-acetyltransferase [Dinghuibacter silviterrae]|uniref:Phosphinothricin acetyltransferase n=1 Tax=Dinghuibacter silviterrae TaxID=1539049 RepID=A0A4V3GKZ5_9BACT|nr:GNAT family N-acetyltransferase [Dinghuibacter silviterrae]TDW97562.1 phosphinothricin acetyltransferase [Dinghuibacter silviterrae]